MFPVLDGAIDSVDSDALREEEIGSSTEDSYPPEYGFRLAQHALNQWRSNACSVFAGTGIVNAANAKEAVTGGVNAPSAFSIDNEGALDLWSDMVKQGMASATEGASNVSLAQFFRMKGLIEGHTVLSTIDQVKNRIYNSYNLFLGSNRCDWGKTQTTGFFTPLPDGQRGPGHFFYACQAVKAGLVCGNSWGDAQKSPAPWAIPEGFFILPWSCLENFGRGGLLYNIYAFADHRDGPRIAAYIKEKGYNELEKAKELGYTNGERLEQSATIYELKVTLARVLGQDLPLKNPIDAEGLISRKATAQRIYEATSSLKSPYQWTPTDPYRNIRRDELARIAVRIAKWVELVR